MDNVCDFIIFWLVFIGGDASVNSPLLSSRNTFQREEASPLPMAKLNGSISELLGALEENNGKRVLTGI